MIGSSSNPDHTLILPSHFIPFFFPTETWSFTVQEDGGEEEEKRQRKDKKTIMEAGEKNENLKEKEEQIFIKYFESIKKQEIRISKKKKKRQH